MFGPTFVEVTGEKLVVGELFVPPILNRVKMKRYLIPIFLELLTTIFWQHKKNERLISLACIEAYFSVSLWSLEN